MVLFWIRGKRAEDSEVVVVVVQSRRLKVKIKELFNLERNGASMRERKAVGMRRADSVFYVLLSLILPNQRFGTI